MLQLYLHAAQVIISQDRVYLSHGAERARLIPTYHSLIQHMRLRVKLPDMVIPLNPGKFNFIRTAKLKQSVFLLPGGGLYNTVRPEVASVAIGLPWIWFWFYAFSVA